jgi:excinuclease UvrABC nuclease subunit
MSEESVRARFRQEWLLKYENPLRKRFSGEFFRLIPRTPGVYTFFDEKRNLLYVGKAKRLRDRLRSYGQVNPENSSRKTVRLVNAIRSIQWVSCETEAEALLLENEWLRTHRPPYNRLNTYPESYLLVGLRVIDLNPWPEIRFRLTAEPKRQGDTLFGAFKGNGRTREGVHAVIRLLWIAYWADEHFLLPQRLASWKCPPLYSVKVPPEVTEPLWEFFQGKSDLLLSHLTEVLLQKENVPQFYHRLIQESLEAAKGFFEMGPRRNREMKSTAGLRTRLVAQEKVDDLVVLHLAKRGLIEG